MGVSRYDIQEDHYTNRLSSQQELSILAGMDSSQYMLCAHDGAPLAIRSLDHPPLSVWWERDERLMHAYRRVRIAWDGLPHTLVPARLFDPTQIQSYLRQLTALPDDMEVRGEAVADLDLYLVYALPEGWPAKWLRHFATAQPSHLLTVLLPVLRQHALQQNQPVVHAYLRGNRLRLVVWQSEGQLAFTNAFTCQASRDFVYFTLLAYDQANLKPTETPLYLFGDILQDAEVFQHFYRFVRHIHFLTPATDSWKPGPQLAQLPPHFVTAPVWLRLHP